MTSNDVIKLAITDDHEGIRQGLSMMLGGLGFEIVVIARNGKDLIRQLETAAVLPDVCLLDINMDELDGYNTAKMITSHWPGTRVLAMTFGVGKDSLIGMLQSGACGYLSKDADADEWERAIKSINNRGFYFSDWMSSQLLFYFRQLPANL